MVIAPSIIANLFQMLQLLSKNLGETLDTAVYYKYERNTMYKT